MRLRVDADAQRPAKLGGGGGGGVRAAAMMPGPTPTAEWEMPYGLRMPMGAYALAASRHMAQLRHDVRAARPDRGRAPAQWAAMNPRARYQDPITVDDVLDSPMIASPLHQLDCCLVTDGAGAFVMTSAERAATSRKPPVYVLGAAHRATTTR